MYWGYFTNFLRKTNSPFWLATPLSLISKKTSSFTLGQGCLFSNLFDFSPLLPTISFPNLHNKNEEYFLNWKFYTLLPLLGTIIISEKLNSLLGSCIIFRIIIIVLLIFSKPVKRVLRGLKNQIHVQEKKYFHISIVKVR